MFIDGQGLLNFGPRAVAGVGAESNRSLVLVSCCFRNSGSVAEAWRDFLKTGGSLASLKAPRGQWDRDKGCLRGFCCGESNPGVKGSKEEVNLIVLLPELPDSRCSGLWGPALCRRSASCYPALISPRGALLVTDILLRLLSFSELIQLERSLPLGAGLVTGNSSLRLGLVLGCAGISLGHGSREVLRGHPEPP